VPAVREWKTVKEGERGGLLQFQKGEEEWITRIQKLPSFLWGAREVKAIAGYPCARWRKMKKVPRDNLKERQAPEVGAVRLP